MDQSSDGGDEDNARVQFANWKAVVQEKVSVLHHSRVGRVTPRSKGEMRDESEGLPRQRAASRRSRAGYLGLTPTLRQSAGRRHHGRIMKAGNPQARAMVVQAVQAASDHLGPLGAFFRRLRKKKSTTWPSSPPPASW